ncbi:unnamed protein product [Musa banksii]
MSSVDTVECSSNCLGGNCDAIAIIPLHLNQLKPKHPLRWLFACKKLRNGYILLSPTVKATQLLLLLRCRQTCPSACAFL